MGITCTKQFCFPGNKHVLSSFVSLEILFHLVLDRGFALTKHCHIIRFKNVLTFYFIFSIFISTIVILIHEIDKTKDLLSLFFSLSPFPLSFPLFTCFYLIIDLFCMSTLTQNVSRY